MNIQRRKRSSFIIHKLQVHFFLVPFSSGFVSVLSDYIWSIWKHWVSINYTFLYDSHAAKQNKKKFHLLDYKTQYLGRNVSQSVTSLPFASMLKENSFYMQQSKSSNQLTVYL